MGRRFHLGNNREVFDAEAFTIYRRPGSYTLDRRPAKSTRSSRTPSRPSEGHDGRSGPMTAVGKGIS